MRKLLCKLGLHSWYLDSAMFHSVHRCNYCSKVEGDEEALTRERNYWSDRGRP